MQGQNLGDYCGLYSMRQGQPVHGQSQRYLQSLLKLPAEPFEIALRFGSSGTSEADLDMRDSASMYKHTYVRDIYTNTNSFIYLFIIYIHKIGHQQSQQEAFWDLAEGSKVGVGQDAPIPPQNAPSTIYYPEGPKYTISGRKKN